MSWPAGAAVAIEDDDRDSLVYVAGGSGALELDGVSYRARGRSGSARARG